MPKRRIGCWKCGKMDYTGYQVHHFIWKQTGLPKHVKFIFVELCIPCLEKIIKRNLTKDDFLFHPILKETSHATNEDQRR